MHITKKTVPAILICMFTCAGLYAQAAAKKGPRINPTMADIKYGPHARNVLDFYKVDSDKPTPVVLFIHGGGFRGAAKRASIKAY